MWRKPSSLERLQRTAQLRPLLADDMRAEGTIGPAAIPLLADALRQVEDDGDRQAVILPGQLHQRAAGLGLHVGRIDDRQLAHVPVAWRR